MPENVRQAAVAARDVARTGKLENKREAALRALLISAGITDQDPTLPQFRDAFGRTWDGFLLALGSKITSEEFLKTINAMIELMQKNNLPTTIWHSVISVMRRYALGGITEPTIMLKAENLFQQARLLAGELSQRTQAYRRLVLEQQESILQGFSFSMAPAMTLDEIGRAISEHFPQMGIERWYVTYYGDVKAPQSVSSPLPENYNLLFQYEASKFEIPVQRASTGTGQLIPRGKTPKDRRYTAVVMPLSLAKKRFGFMWVEMGPKDWEVYVRIRNLVSSALLRTELPASGVPCVHACPKGSAVGLRGGSPSGLGRGAAPAGDGPGASVTKRVAAPTVGGLASSFALELLVYPALFAIWERREVR